VGEEVSSGGIGRPDQNFIDQAFNEITITPGPLTFPAVRSYGIGGGGGDPRVSERLHADGMVFRYPNGDAWRWKMVSAFRALQRWDRGEDLDPFVTWVKSVGANGLRVFCQYNSGIGGADPLTPEAVSSSRIWQFAQWLRERDLRVEFTVLADCAQLGQNHEAQKQRVRDVVSALVNSPWAFVEIANEPFKNGADVAAIARELGYDRGRAVLMATGDYSCDPGMLVLDYIGDHAERKASWPGEAGKTGHFVYDGWDPDANSPHGWRGSKCPVIADEPIGCVELPVDQVPDFGRRDNRPEAFEDGFAGFAVGMAGGCFHSDAGVQTVMPGPVTTECARRAFAAMDFFPADAPTGRYVHDGFPAHPLASIAGFPPDRNADEVAGRVFGDRAYAVAAHPGPHYRPEPKAGWRIVKATARGNAVVLER
jgi:hypothetical protein